MDGGYPFPTLPDYLAPGLDLVFIGINPSPYSVERGHYFARPSNRFWHALSGSRLSAPVRLAVGRHILGPPDDALLLEFGIGFTDVVKRPTPMAADLSRRDYREWSPSLFERLERYRPRVACFHGATGYRPFVRYVLEQPDGPITLGPQPLRIGETRLFVVPNPSPANARFRLADLIAWYDRLAEFLDHVGDHPDE